MSINISAKPDYTSLFSSLTTSSSGTGSMSGLTSLLSDYSSIKNGSYSKLMKAYYAKNASDSKTSGSTTNSSSIAMTTDTAKILSKVEESADALKESADALLETGTKKVFTEDATTESVYSAVSSFVGDYNSLISATADATASSITGRTATLTNATAINEKALSAVGITINKDNTLTLDKDTFLSADISKVKSLFSGNASYGYQASVQASFIDFAATNEANKSNTYNFSGSYSSSYSTGSIYDSLF